MLKFDKSKGILYCYKSELARPNLCVERGVHNNYKSVQNFYNGNLEKILRDVVAKIYLAVHGKDADLSKLVIEDGFYYLDDEVKVKDSIGTTVNIKLSKTNIFDDLGLPRDSLVTIKLATFPYVTKDGIVHYKYNDFGFINIIEQQPTISYEANATNSNPPAIKIKHSGPYLKIEKKDKLICHLSDIHNNGSKAMKAFNMFQLLGAMARQEGLSAYGNYYFQTLRNYKLINQYKGIDRSFSSSDISDIRLEYIIDFYFNGGTSTYRSKADTALAGIKLTSENSFNYGNYNTSDIRKSLNNLVSLDRVEGEVLARPVRSNRVYGRLLATKGQVIDSHMLELFNKHGVKCIYIKNIPMIEGMYLRETDGCILREIAVGTRLTDDLKEYLRSIGNYKYDDLMYANENISLQYEVKYRNADGKIISTDYEYLQLKDKDMLTKGTIEVIANQTIANSLNDDKFGTEHSKYYNDILSRYYDRETDTNLNVLLDSYDNLPVDEKLDAICRRISNEERNMPEYVYKEFWDVDDDKKIILPDGTIDDYYEYPTNEKLNTRAEQDIGRVYRNSLYIDCDVVEEVVNGFSTGNAVVESIGARKNFREYLTISENKDDSESKLKRVYFEEEVYNNSQFLGSHLNGIPKQYWSPMEQRFVYNMIKYGTISADGKTISRNVSIDKNYAESVSENYRAEDYESIENEYYVEEDLVDESEETNILNKDRRNELSEEDKQIIAEDKEILEDNKADNSSGNSSSKFYYYDISDWVLEPLNAQELNEFLNNPIYKYDDNVWYYLYDKYNIFIPVQSKEYKHNLLFKNTEQYYSFYTFGDILALTDFSIKLFDGKWINRVSNADTGFRKRAVTLGEQYERVFERFIREGFDGKVRRYIRSLMSKHQRSFKLFDIHDDENKVQELCYKCITEPMWKHLRDKTKCLTSLSNSALHNPIAYQSELTKLNVFTPNKHSVSDTQRDIAMGFYGKIDPYEIPQSSKLGTVNNATTTAIIDEFGNIKTSYYPIKYDTSKKMYYVDVAGIIAITTQEEEESASMTIGDIASLKIGEYVKDSNGKVIRAYITNPDDVTMCRTPDLNNIIKQTVTYRYIRDLNYVNISANQAVSWGCATIPFMDANDSARAIFAVSQEKQAKGLHKAEEPDVMTSAYEQFPWLNDKFGVIARDDGEVESIRTNHNEIILTVTYYHHNEFGEPFTQDEIDAKDNKVEYILGNYLDSGYSITKYKINVKPHEKFNKGKMLISSNFISDRGILTFGINALAFYLCDGYNYEDGNHNSEDAVSRLASYKTHYENFSKEDMTSFKMSKDRGVNYISKGSEIISKVRIKGSRSVDIHIPFEVKELDSFYEREEKSNKYENTYKVSTVTLDNSEPGDKSSNRHGNKGVLSKVEPTANMARLKNGMVADVCLNPLGVATRMNIGQIDDILVGLAAHVCKYQISADSDNSCSSTEIRNLMWLTHALMNSTYPIKPDEINGMLSEAYNIALSAMNGTYTLDTLVSSSSDSSTRQGFLNILVEAMYKDIPMDLLEHCLQKDVLRHIRLYAGCFNEYGATTVLIPDNNGTYTETKVLVGYIYIFKLIQEVQTKVHARAGETHQERMLQLLSSPTKGSSNDGGQGLGTMEMFGLMAYGVSSYIQECTNIKCDNPIARNNFYVQNYLPVSRHGEGKVITKATSLINNDNLTITTTNIKYVKDNDSNKLKKVLKEFKKFPNNRLKIQGQRNSVTYFVNMLLALGIAPIPTNDEFMSPFIGYGNQLERYNYGFLSKAEDISNVEQYTNNISNNDSTVIAKSHKECDAFTEIFGENYINYQPNDNNEMLLSIRDFT